jgi:hypothetical protein
VSQDEPRSITVADIEALAERLRNEPRELTPLVIPYHLVEWGREALCEEDFVASFPGIPYREDHQ